MPELIVFNSMSLDGYFTDANGDISWAHEGSDDPEWNAFVAGNASGEGILLFGRVTYQLMAGFWPTPAALETMPEVAAGMNRMPKIVFSRTLNEVSWSNTRLVKGDLVGEVRKLKQTSDKGIAILGSGSIVSQLAPEGLIDQYQVVVKPIVLGAGRTMFEGIREQLNLRLTRSRTFANGNVLLCYAPA